jgi:hypothetical protein
MQQEWCVMKNMHNEKHHSELKKRLQNYEEKPNDALWFKIKSAISSENGYQLKDRLSNYSEQPDELVWMNIRQTLTRHRTIDRVQRCSHVVAVIALMMLSYPFYRSQEEKFLKSEPLRSYAHNDSLSHKSIAHAENRIKSLSGRKKINEGVKIDIDSKDKNSALKNTVHPEKHQSFEYGVSNNAKPILKNAETKSSNEKTPLVTIEPGRSQISNIEVIDNSILSEGTSNVGSKNDVVDVFPDSIMDKSFPKENILSFKNSSVADKKSTMDLNLKNDSLDLVEKNLAAKNLKRDTVSKHQKQNNRLNHNLNIYALIMPTLGYQQVQPLKDDGIFIEGIKRVSAFSSKRLGIRIETGIEKRLCSSVNIHLGVLYYQRKQTLIYYYTDSLHSVVTPIHGQSLTYEVTPEKQAGSYQYEVNNIGVIAGLNYTVSKKKIVQRIGVAGELHKCLSRNKSFFLFGDMYYRISYQLNDRFDLMFQPTINYSLQLDDQLNAPFYIKPYGLGLNFGVYFKLR